MTSGSESKNRPGFLQMVFSAEAVLQPLDYHAAPSVRHAKDDEDMAGRLSLT